MPLYWKVGTGRTLPIGVGAVSNGRALREGGLGNPATAADTFTGDQWWLGQITFNKDQPQSAIGFQVTGSRVRPIAFSKKVL